MRAVFADTLIYITFSLGPWLGEIFGTVKFSLKWKIAHKFVHRSKTLFSAILLNFENYITTFL